ncbi:MAG: Fe-S cluster assembly protein HesB [Deltaproteobacteria bacterium]|nr:Fe-S cluster assembly protein HesB [Deltaproteobacteria bacterium]
MTATHQLPAPFDLRLVIKSHGWVDLPPFRASEDARTLWRPVRAKGRVEAARIHQAAPGAPLEIESPEAALPVVRRMLALEADLEGLSRLARAEERLEWIALGGAGRLLRGATLFEDLLKILLTTNTTWSATRRMTERVMALGPFEDFPEPSELADVSEDRWRSEVKVGYRTRSARNLVSEFLEGSIDEQDLLTMPTPAVWRRLSQLDGFGPYAVGQALRLLGRHDHLALDSWCRARFAELTGKPRSDQEIERAYESYGAHRGIVMWLDLTRDWHGIPAADAHRRELTAKFKPRRAKPRLARKAPARRLRAATRKQRPG